MLMLRLEVTRLGQDRTGQDRTVDRNDLSFLLVLGCCGCRVKVIHVGKFCVPCCVMCDV